MYAQLKEGKMYKNRVARGCFIQQKTAFLLKPIVQKAEHKYVKYAKELSPDIVGESKDLKVKEGKLKYKIFNYEGAKILEVTDLVSDRFTKGSGVKLMKQVMEIGKEAGCDIVRLIAESSGHYGRLGQRELLTWYENRGLHNIKPGGTFGRWMVGDIDECLRRGSLRTAAGSA
ncbi:hypothetical protein [Pseudoalteromonas sp. OOF1S-7]|uniref:hypothetical protein n=1 Tax=Pseudoalteromonas sp. OOF1S-7 TaxID=2917757 RepID=UPI001EF4B752|nr:hypothetical protein [Pseudoalteromonas sp. OOF1S-7]MCG7534149.1 hypothetical protein [Pseudoalteromonas sp. OOF1S-7]